MGTASGISKTVLPFGCMNGLGRFRDEYEVGVNAG
jgi:hypothetical protein